MRFRAIARCVGIMSRDDGDGTATGFPLKIWLKKSWAFPLKKILRHWVSQHLIWRRRKVSCNTPMIGEELFLVLAGGWTCNVTIVLWIGHTPSRCGGRSKRSTKKDFSTKGLSQCICARIVKRRSLTLR